MVRHSLGRLCTEDQMRWQNNSWNHFTKCRILRVVICMLECMTHCDPYNIFNAIHSLELLQLRMDQWRMGYLECMHVKKGNVNQLFSLAGILTESPFHYPTSDNFS